MLLSNRISKKKRPNQIRKLNRETDLDSEFDESEIDFSESVFGVQFRNFREKNKIDIDIDLKRNPEEFEISINLNERSDKDDEIDSEPNIDVIMPGTEE